MSNFKVHVHHVALAKAKLRSAQYYLQVGASASSSNAIKSIEFARRSKSFLVNTADRVIRIYRTTDVLGIKEGDK